MYNKHGGYFGRESVVDYSVNINPLGVSTALRDKLWNTIDEIERYPQIDGIDVKEKLSARLHIEMDRLIIGNGATELIYLFSRALDIKKSLVVEPTFTEYAKSVELIGGKVSRFSLEKPDFRLDIESLLKTAEREEAEAIYICSPNNPTGGAVSKEDIERIAKGCKDLGIYLFLDESFIEFSDRESCMEITHEYDLFVLRSITKIYGVPGIRIGYGVGKRDIVEQMNKVKEPWSVNCMALKTMESYLEDDDYRTETEKWYSKEKKRFAEKLLEIDYMELFDSEANFLLCKLKSGNAREIQSYLLHRGFYIRTCEDFYGLDESYIRLAVRVRAENDGLLECLRLYRGGDAIG